jgi:hypothetical protein
VLDRRRETGRVVTIICVRRHDRRPHHGEREERRGRNTRRVSAEPAEHRDPA